MQPVALRYGVLQISPCREGTVALTRFARTAAVETGGEIHDGAWVAELTGDFLTGWPKGMRLIVRKGRPHPGAQLRLRDADGMWLTCFAANTSDRPIAELELCHRLRVRSEDRIHAARAAGLRTVPLHRPEPDLAGDRADRSRPAGLDADARPDRQGQALGAPPITLRLFTAAGQLVTTGRRNPPPGPATSPQPSTGSLNCPTPDAQPIPRPLR